MPTPRVCFDVEDDLIRGAASGKANVIGAPATRRTLARRATPVVAGVTFAVGATAGWSLSTTTRFAPGSARPLGPGVVSAADADLLAAKAEAESLAVAGRLAEAHAAYRRLAARTVGRAFDGRLTWDLAERAKAEQDRVYWVLLSNTRGADAAFFRGRGGSAADPGVLASGRRVPAAAGGRAAGR